jgi:4-hydroxy-3-polyprenylbenzoate decarboxylase
MAYSGLKNFISELDRNGELHRIKVFVDPVLEIAEITDRVTKSGGRALLFENNGTRFPVLINAFGSDRRIAMALGMNDLAEAGNDIEKVFELITDSPTNMMGKIMALPRFLKITGYLPTLSGSRGSCQQNICLKPDLSILPVLKCWPHDGGRFITLPMVHTIHPVTGRSNVGMYRMQILGSDTTGMHWQRHKTGANHFDAWKATGKRMPVSVTLGGDPVYTYCATAPLPENISEYILAGFLRKKKVKLVKCITNNIYVPSDADIVIEGYVDPAEEFVSEGPFGYPVFHVTCITHSEGAVYPATIVGVPPHEDAWLAKATEKIFLSPVRLAIQPEILDFHMPEAGVAHNLVVVRINKSYPGQGMKVINSLFGAGQMMFTKYLVVVSGTLDIRNYKELMIHIFTNTDFRSDILFTHGPLDVLDHSSDNFSFGGKAGVDATVKLPEEMQGRHKTPSVMETSAENNINWLNRPFIKGFRLYPVAQGTIILILAVDPSEDPGIVRKVCDLLKENTDKSVFRLVIAVDHTVDRDDLSMVAWQVLGNSDPGRDHCIISPDSLLIDGSIKFYREGGFPRRWPNIVCSDAITIENADKKWDTLGFEKYLPSPSVKNMRLIRKGADGIEK